MAKSDEKQSLQHGLVGRWLKVTRTPQAAQYPDQLEFTERGTFVGANDASSRYHPYWDAGCFQLVEGDKVRIPAANDAVIDYPATLKGDELIFMIGDKEAIQYRREA